MGNIETYYHKKSNSYLLIKKIEILQVSEVVKLGDAYVKKQDVVDSIPVQGKSIKQSVLVYKKIFDDKNMAERYKGILLAKDDASGWIESFLIPIED